MSVTMLITNYLEFQLTIARTHGCIGKKMYDIIKAIAAGVIRKKDNDTPEAGIEALMKGYDLRFLYVVDSMCAIVNNKGNLSVT